MQRSDAFEAGVSSERYLERCRLKTASLFECAAILGRDDPAADEALVGYGHQIGLAFQLLDDVLDVAGPPERTGKARGTDLLDGTVTMPLIVARRRDPALAGLDLRALDGPAAERTCDAIAATGALDEVRSDARERVAEAKRLAVGSSLSGEQRELLGVVADGVVERYS
jgi:geranylgeranyl pyrophosphate synthase